MRRALTESIRMVTHALHNEPGRQAAEALASIAQAISMAGEIEFQHGVRDVQEVFDLATAKGFAGQSIVGLQAAVQATRSNTHVHRADVHLLALSLASAHAGCRDYVAAVATLEELVRQRDIDPDLLGLATFNLGCCYGSGGDSTRAVELIRRSLVSAAQRGLGESEVASMQVGLARALLDLGEYAEARDLAERAIPILDKQADQMEAAVARDVFGKALEYRGEYGKARRQFEDALKLVRSQVGEEHPIYAVALSNLATVCGAQGDYKTAEQLLANAYEITAHTLGVDNPQTIPILCNLLMVRAETADTDGQKRLLLSLHERLSRLPTHPIALGLIWHRLGVLEQVDDRFEEANACFQRAADLLRTSPFLDVVRSQMARLATRRGHVDEAASLYEDLARSHIARHTDHTNEYAAAVLGSAEIALGRSQWSAAIEQAQRAQSLMGRNVGHTYPDRARCLTVMCCGYVAQRDYVQALACCATSPRCKAASFSMW